MVQVGEEMKRLEDIGILISPTTNDIFIDKEVVYINPTSYFEHFYFPRQTSNLSSFITIIRESVKI